MKRWKGSLLRFDPALFPSRGPKAVQCLFEIAVIMIRLQVALPLGRSPLDLIDSHPGKL
jgi:hypothetical protein